MYPECKRWYGDKSLAIIATFTAWIRSSSHTICDPSRGHPVTHPSKSKWGNFTILCTPLSLHFTLNKFEHYSTVKCVSHFNQSLFCWMLIFVAWCNENDLEFSGRFLFFVNSLPGNKVSTLRTLVVRPVLYNTVSTEPGTGRVKGVQGSLGGGEFKLHARLWLPEPSGPAQPVRHR